MHNSGKRKHLKIKAAHALGIPCPGHSHTNIVSHTQLQYANTELDIITPLQFVHAIKLKAR